MKRLESKISVKFGALPSCHSPILVQVAGHHVLWSVLFQSVPHCALESFPRDVLCHDSSIHWNCLNFGTSQDD